MEVHLLIHGSFVQVDLYLSRDLDSRLTVRETAAVQEWVHSGDLRKYSIK